MEEIEPVESISLKFQGVDKTYHPLFYYGFCDDLSTDEITFTFDPKTLHFLVETDNPRHSLLDAISSHLEADVDFTSSRENFEKLVAEQSEYEILGDKVLEFEKNGAHFYLTRYCRLIKIKAMEVHYVKSFHAGMFYEHILDQLIKDENVKEISVEDPNEQFMVIRNKVDFARVTSLQPDIDDLLNRNKFKELKSNIKITDRQLFNCLERHLYYSCSDKDKERLRRFMKKRIYVDDSVCD
ncbi:hypothetical protein O9G_001997 [Rozella allomycis CSF55]|uniref:Uncharacterized protein n=1 Tax=Rozella allomycis (strain CSF55) TaxID=988480 RepID=A0A075B1L9_ROZAC|nr:hypothetical protein O9G_001997 [Rozella allomycis CSF55]|eukprot:EPZ34866.1 hypothetical protein O9G_001997 [Rozella allomycis CSF55]